jgi:NADH-quinone oxidoreductase subunit A
MLLRCSAAVSHSDHPHYIYDRDGPAAEISAVARVQRGKRRQQELTMESLLREYFPILVFLAIAGGVSIAMVTASVVIARQRPDKEKLSPYECGFDPFDDARIRFDVRYYLVAILFIIFDLEVAFLFPWAVSLGDIGMFGFWSMVVFLAVLTIGFIYEWKKGALEWE